MSTTKTNKPKVQPPTSKRRTTKATRDALVFKTNELQRAIDDKQAQHAGNGAAGHSDAPVELGSFISLIPLGDLISHPQNPRRNFDGQQLAELAASLRTVGMLQPIVAREIADGQYQIVAGERRARAARLAQLTSVPVIVVEMTEPAALEAMLTENVQREDLNPIETAAALKTLTTPVDEGGAGLTQTEAAERFGKSQSWVANLVRLLKLPKSVRQRVISGEIEETKARTLLPYIDAPVVIEAVFDELENIPENFLTREDWEDNLPCTAQHATLPIDTNEKVGVDGVHAKRKFKLTDDVLKRLDVVTIPVRDWGDKKPKTERRAQNVKLWRELQSDALKAAGEAAGEASGKASGKTKAAADKPVKRTPAEAKRLAAAQQQHTDKHVKAWRIRLVRDVVIERFKRAKSTPISLEAKRATEAVVKRLLLLLAQGGGSRDVFIVATSEPIRAAGGSFKSWQRWRNVESVPAGKLTTVAAGSIEAYLSKTDAGVLDDEVWESLLVELGGSMGEGWSALQTTSVEWKKGKPRVMELCGFHSKEATFALAKELKVEVVGTTKADAERAICAVPDRGRKLALPKCLQAAGPKPKRTTTKKRKVVKK